MDASDTAGRPPAIEAPPPRALPVLVFLDAPDVAGVVAFRVAERWMINGRLTALILPEPPTSLVCIPKPACPPDGWMIVACWLLVPFTTWAFTGRAIAPAEGGDTTRPTLRVLCRDA